MIQSGSEAYLYSSTGELLQTTIDSEAVLYSYDGTGRRIARTDNTGTWQYLYGNLNNPFQLTAMRDPAGVLSYYYYDNNGRLFAFDKGAARYYVASDQVGTPKVVTDATGTVVKQMEYDSFGMATFDSNPAFDIPVGFAGGITDTKTGLVRFGYRDYEPGTGRWTAKGPIFFGGGQGNLYGYVSNDPINWIDPDGLEIKFPLIDNFIDPPKEPPSDAEIALQFLPVGSVAKVTRSMSCTSEVIAKGRNIRKVEELVEKFGGKIKDWLKKKGWDDAGNEWHWYENKGRKVGIKKPGELDPF